MHAIAILELLNDWQSFSHWAKLVRVALAADGQTVLATAILVALLARRILNLMDHHNRSHGNRHLHFFFPPDFGLYSFFTI